MEEELEVLKDLELVEIEDNSLLVENKDINGCTLSAREYFP